MVAGLTSLNEVNGGGAALGQDWKQELDGSTPLKVVKEVGEARLPNSRVGPFYVSPLAHGNALDSSDLVADRRRHQRQGTRGEYPR